MRILIFDVQSWAGETFEKLEDGNDLVFVAARSTRALQKSTTMRT